MRLTSTDSSFFSHECNTKLLYPINNDAAMRHMYFELKLKSDPSKQNVAPEKWLSSEIGTFL